MKVGYPYLHAAEQLAAAFGEAPSGAIVLGSGGGPIAARWPTVGAPRSYASLALVAPTVPGHAGEARLVTVNQQRLLVLSGRIHAYEGHDNEAMLRTMRALAVWGVKRVCLTSAVGALRADLPPGSLVQIVDHMNLSPNPLIANHAPLGPRFPDLSRVYSPRLGALLQTAAAHHDATVPQGVYAMMTGPSYETPAEARMLRVLGADVAGMSMPIEAIGAVQAGVEVLGVAVVSNLAAGLTEEDLTHEEVLVVVGQAIETLGRLLEDLVGQW